MTIFKFVNYFFNPDFDKNQDNHNYKMKNTTFLLSLLLSLTNCKGPLQTNKIDLNVPDKVEIKKEGNRNQFPGTRVFIKTPNDYFLIPSLIRFQKDNDTYIQAEESPKTNYTEQKTSILKASETAKLHGSTVYYQKEFKLGDYDAFIIYGSDNKPNLDEMVLTFGDSEFAVMVVGKLQHNNTRDRQEVLSALLTIYLNKSSVPDYSALSNYTLDLSHSEFKFNSNMSQVFYYTINGQGDPVNNPFENVIIVMTLPSMESFEARKDYSKSMIQSYKKNGVLIPTFDEKEIEINGERAYELTFPGSFQGRSAKVYQIVLGDSKATILFCGTAYDKQDYLIEQFKSIAQTLKTK
jgi:hypothetical protein